MPKVMAGLACPTWRLTNTTLAPPEITNEANV
jgi:hypothetical protein